jgi:hypothetical protein
MLCVAMVTVLLAVATPHAQKTEAERAREVRKGNRIILAGLCMAAAGTFILLLSNKSGEAPAGGFGLMAAGGAVVWVGAIDRSRAVQPQTTIGVALGPVKAVQVRRTW